MSTPNLTRRERVREQTLREIEEHALAQVAAGGVAALSLNAIAKAMGMSGPAIYRYFGSRDELLAALVTDGYARARRTSSRPRRSRGRRRPPRSASPPSPRPTWRGREPTRTATTCCSASAPRPTRIPAEAIEAIQPAMVALLGAPGRDRRRRRRARAGREARGGSCGAGPRRERGADAPPPGVLKLGVLAWSRLHGIASLELAGILGDMGLDAGLLAQAEVDDLVASAAP